MGFNIDPESRAHAQPAPYKKPQASIGEDRLGRIIRESNAILHGPGALFDRLFKVASMENEIKLDLMMLDLCVLKGADFIVTFGNEVNSFKVFYMDSKFRMSSVDIIVKDEKIDVGKGWMTFENFEKMSHDNAQHFVEEWGPDYAKKWAQKIDPKIDPIEHPLIARLSRLDMATRTHPDFLNFVRTPLHLLVEDAMGCPVGESQEIKKQYMATLQSRTTSVLSDSLSQFLKTQNISQLYSPEHYDLLKQALFDEMLKQISMHKSFIAITGVYYTDKNEFAQVEKKDSIYEALMYDILVQAVNTAVENIKPAELFDDDWKPLK